MSPTQASEYIIVRDQYKVGCKEPLCRHKAQVLLICRTYKIAKRELDSLVCTQSAHPAVDNDCETGEGYEKDEVLLHESAPGSGELKYVGRLYIQGPIMRREE